MSVKKVDEKELEKVAGGMTFDDNAKIACPSCGYYGEPYNFQIECIDEGCTHYKRYTCSNCGHVWTIEV